mmetsp:Transcript_33767/g.62057  ORF Transcript_33767/g.62057 Transcript_33767/m.62057 type:complete len:129 (-) Transcript_33767:1569-1955(-)
MRLMMRQLEQQLDLIRQVNKNIYFHTMTFRLLNGIRIPIIKPIRLATHYSYARSPGRIRMALIYRHPQKERISMQIFKHNDVRGGRALKWHHFINIQSTRQVIYLSSKSESICYKTNVQMRPGSLLIS